MMLADAFYFLYIPKKADFPTCPSSMNAFYSLTNGVFIKAHLYEKEILDLVYKGL